MAKSHPDFHFKEPIGVASQKFIANKWACYDWMLEEKPVCRAKMGFMNFLVLSRYDDCVEFAKDPRFVRNRLNAGGKRKLPVPLPKSIATLTGSMIYEDGEEHRRLRNLVNQGFKPQAVAKLGDRIDRLTHEILDAAGREGRMDLMRVYAQPIPVTVIGEIVGIDSEDMHHFANATRILTEGLRGWSVARTLLWDMRRSAKLVREIIRKKKTNPGSDILTELMGAEEAGDRLSEDEVLSMVFLLIIAGHETTVHLINNGLLALFEHPEQLERLRDEPERIDSAVEEMLRFCSPVHGSKPAVAIEDISWNGFEIEKGTNVIPNWAAANRDPRAFPDPNVFDIARNPNHHLAFAHGAHFCLGAQLARLETKIAISNLLARYPDLELDVDPAKVGLVNMPFWHRHESYPVRLG